MVKKGSLAPSRSGSALPGRAKALKARPLKAKALKVKPPAPGIEDLRHDATRPNNPKAGDIDWDRLPRKQKTYAYDPHLPPTLDWAGKVEREALRIDGVSLHIHQYISALDILRAIQREDVQTSLWPELPLSKQIDFYAHEVGWSNRMILGDSLTVMNSLLEREKLARKVQCIYIDPPYGVKFNSNFQPHISKREVKDGDDASLTREPEQIQAYRDTWELGIHSYLTYLRDRLMLSRELLSETGSIFVQISDENVHHVRELMDEVFGAANFCSQIAFSKTSSATAALLPGTMDYILWYARDIDTVKYRAIYRPKRLGGEGANKYDQIQLSDGTRRALSAEERSGARPIPAGARVFCLGDMTSQSVGREKGEGAASWFPVTIGDREFLPNAQSRWKTNQAGMARLVASGRIAVQGNSLRYVRYLDDFAAFGLSNNWDDIGGIQSRSDPKIYVVQTATTAVARCILMTTDPSDLVLDPTCGSGTTAYVAEQWGRRWISCDTSRVALALARQRILGARFPYYRLRSARVVDGFVYKSIPHITLKSIAQNPRLDQCKSQDDRERAIRQSAEQEILYDQPEEDNKRVRVSGPFTVEAIPVATFEQANDAASEPPSSSRNGNNRVSNPPADYLTMMIDLVKKTGVRFPNKRHLSIPTLRSIKAPYEYLHAEGESDMEGDPRRIAVSFGSQHAPVTPFQVRDAMDKSRGYDIILFIGFGCDPEARRMMEAVRGREVQFVHAAPDILVNDLLKTKKTSTLFTVFGSPDVGVHKQRDGQVIVELTGVDLYDPITGNTTHDSGENVAAWFVDQNYDGRTFCISQALFPARNIKDPWEKLQKALRGRIDEATFETLRSTKSLPFKPGKKIAVAVIDDRGNEVIKLIEASGG
jgi:adenine-specific DNA-methyltransferase